MKYSKKYHIQKFLLQFFWYVSMDSWQTFVDDAACDIVELSRIGVKRSTVTVTRLTYFLNSGIPNSVLFISDSNIFILVDALM